ncbi:uncharacterized protein TNCV_2357281 [Trichonephila clavipes]|nr:uncharacterized protein TNCV_2357281 [Trichonephila clavipes]
MTANEEYALFLQLTMTAIQETIVDSAPGQPIGVTVHFTQEPIREQPLSSQPKQKLFKTYHPDKAQKPRLPDPIIQPIAVMPPSRTKNPTFAMPLIEDLSRNGIEDCSYSPEAQKSSAYSTPILLVKYNFEKLGHQNRNEILRLL